MKSSRSAAKKRKGAGQRPPRNGKSVKKSNMKSPRSQSSGSKSRNRGNSPASNNDSDGEFDERSMAVNMNAIDSFIGANLNRKFKQKLGDLEIEKDVQEMMKKGMKLSTNLIEKEFFLDQKSMTDVFSQYFSSKTITHFVANKHLFRVVDKDIELDMESGKLLMRNKPVPMVPASNKLRSNIQRITKYEEQYLASANDVMNPTRIKNFEDYLNSDPEMPNLTPEERKIMLKLEVQLVKEAESKAVEFTHGLQAQRNQIRQRRAQKIQRERQENLKRKEVEDKLKQEREEADKLRKLELLQSNKEKMEERIRKRKEINDQRNKEFLAVKNKKLKEYELIRRQKEMYDKIKEERLEALKQRHKLDHDELRKHELKIKQIVQERKRQKNHQSNFSIRNVHSRNSEYKPNYRREGSRGRDTERSGDGSRRSGSLHDVSPVPHRQKMYNPSEINSKYLIELMREQKKDKFQIKQLEVLKNKRRARDYSQKISRKFQPLQRRNSENEEVYNQMKRQAHYGKYLREERRAIQQRNKELPDKFFKVAKRRIKKNNANLTQQSDTNVFNQAEEDEDVEKFIKTEQQLVGNLSKIDENNPTNEASKTGPVRRKHPNYLQEIRKDMKLKKSVNDWEKIVNRNGSKQAKFEDYQKILIEAEKLERQAQTKESLQKHAKDHKPSSIQTGLANEEVDNLYFNSIKAKLAVLKEM